MNRDEFNRKLKNLGLKKKEFAEIAGISYHTVLSWGRDGDKVKVPGWVEKFLIYYEKARRFDAITKQICSEN